MSFNKQLILPLAGFITSMASPGYQFSNHNQDCWLSSSLNVYLHATAPNGENKLIDLISDEVGDCPVTLEGNNAIAFTDADKSTFEFKRFLDPNFLNIYPESNTVIPKEVIKNIRRCMFNGIAGNNFMIPANNYVAQTKNPVDAFTAWFATSYPTGINAIVDSYNTGNDQVAIVRDGHQVRGEFFQLMTPFFNAAQNNTKVQHILFVEANHLVQPAIYDNNEVIAPAKFQDTVTINNDVYELVGFSWSPFLQHTWYAWLKNENTDDEDERWVKTHAGFGKTHHSEFAMWYTIHNSGISDFGNALYKRVE